MVGEGDSFCWGEVGDEFLAVGWEQFGFVEDRLNSQPTKCLDDRPPEAAYYGRAG